MSPSGHSTGPGAMPLTRISGPSFASQCARQHRKPGFGDAVDGMSLERPQRVDIDHVDDEPALHPQARCRGLRQKQGSLQIAAHEIVPLRHGDAADRGGVKSRGIVD